MLVMYMVVERKGEARVKTAVLVMRCMVVPRMKWDLPSSSGSGLEGSEPSSGFLGVDMCGMGRSMGNCERKRPMKGTAGTDFS